MTAQEQRRRAQLFAQKWQQKAGYEKGQTQAFWLELLRDVLDMPEASEHIQFEVPVQFSAKDDSGSTHTSFIDALLPEAHVLIEQKSASRDLSKKVKQSDGSTLSPFAQAVRYDENLPLSHRARYIVICNFKQFAIYDREQPHTPPEVIKLEDLSDNLERLSFLTNIGDGQTNPRFAPKIDISIEAAKFVTKLYDLLLAQYTPQDQKSPQALQSLNKLCVRLVFCLYAEDAGLFQTLTQFKDLLAPIDPEHIRREIMDLFRVLNTKEDERDPYELPAINAFPYIDGGLFQDGNIVIPLFTQEIKDLLLNQGDAGFNFKWRDINPTIFGALFESTLNPETRRQGGMHYTSIENIHKVIDPLFLDDLEAEFADIINVEIKSVVAGKRQAQKLERFQEKLASLTFLDPACGSGNFLTETYLSLRNLENRVLRARLKSASLGAEIFDPIKVSISQFYGIEINDFAVSVARSALWIAESQMIQETSDIVGRDLDFFPLKSYPNIVETNALTTPWNDVVNYEQLNYIIGNPPFSGARKKTKEQKADLVQIFGVNWPNIGDLDYVSAWFKKAADIIELHPTIQAAFVATNSICQGTSVANLWENLLSQPIEIYFAYRSFIWDNEAAPKAHVYCVIVGLKNKAQDLFSPKFLFAEDGAKASVEHINAYLSEGDDVFIHNRTAPLWDVPQGSMGNQPIDDGHYLFTPEEKDAFLEQEPKAAPFFHRWYGAEELIQGKQRYCLYLGSCTEAELENMPLVRKRVEAVRKYRQRSTRDSTVKMAQEPTKFQTQNTPNTPYLVIPEVSSSERQYIPIGFMRPQDGLCSNKLKLFPQATLYHFSVLTSVVHMIWVNAVCGRLKMDFSYPNTLVYNNFPWPEKVSEKLKQQIEAAGSKILQVRDQFASYSLAQLYDPEKMPEPLRQAHAANDALVKEAYGFAPDLSDAQILSRLFALYQKRIKELEQSEAAPVSDKAKTKAK